MFILHFYYNLCSSTLMLLLGGVSGFLGLLGRAQGASVQRMCITSNAYSSYVLASTQRWQPGLNELWGSLRRAMISTPHKRGEELLLASQAGRAGRWGSGVQIPLLLSSVLHQLCPHWWLNAMAGDSSGAPTWSDCPACFFPLWLCTFPGFLYGLNQGARVSVV